MIRLFLISVFVALGFLSGIPASALELTPDEAAFVKASGPISFCVDPDWEPFEIVDAAGHHVGIAADLLRLAAQRVGLSLQLLRTKDWDESIAASKEGRCKLMSFLNQTPKRDAWLLFTDPVFTDANVFITREEHPFIVDPAGLVGESIVLPTGTSIEERIRRDYPNLKVLLVPSEAEAIDMVSRKRASMTMRSLIVAAYTIRKEGLFNLKISGQLPNYANNLRIGVLKSEPMLRDVLNKGVNSITPTERGEIVNRHVAINVQAGVDYLLIGEIVLGFIVVLAVALLWGWQMRNHGRQMEKRSQTDTLTGLANRTRINLQFPAEVDRARRFQRPLSVVMLDIDHFKRINDELGHLVGDKVLVEVAEILRHTVRVTDMASRWGGEEFLILCPETTLDQATILAERIREAVLSHDFASGRSHSVSLGVSDLRQGDDMDSLLHRADTALYEAKDGGRNRVCIAA